MKTLNSSADYSAVADSGKCVVKIGSSCCGPCRLMHDNLSNLEPKYPDWNFFEIDADECEDGLLDKFDVDAIPTTVFFVNGNARCTLVGVLTSDKIEAMLLE